MLIEDLIKRKQDGVKYGRDENNDVIMTLTDYKVSFKLVQCYDDNGDSYIGALSLGG